MVLTVPLVTIPMLKGYSTDGQNVMGLGGTALFFYALIHLLKRATYYVILGAIIVILWILAWLVKFNPGKDIGEGLGFFLIAGFIACIIGILRWRKYD
jgi:VIT1/CCC1 family predicted Fe2+/Mn2+ transporter